MLAPDTCRTVLEILPHGLYVVDRERRIQLWNNGAEQITGYRSQEVIGRCCHDDLLMHCDVHGGDLCGSGCPLLATMRDGEPRDIPVLLRHRDGDRVPARVMTAALRDEHGTIIGAVESFEEPGAAGEPVRAPAPQTAPGEDELTGLLLRPAVELHLAAAARELVSLETPCAVLSLAIDGLDQFQRSYGLPAAEALIRSAAHTIAGNVHPGIVGRWSAERFVAVLRDCPEGAIAGAAERIRRAVQLTSICWWGDHLSSTLSVGVASSRPGDTAASLLDRSEEALQRCLREGGDRVALG